MESIYDPAEWNQILTSLPDPHLLQSWEWGAFKERYGWHPERWVWRASDGRITAAAQVLFRRARGIPLMGYCPRGPLLDWSQVELRHEVLADLGEQIAGKGFFYLKIEPGTPQLIDTEPSESSVELYDQVLDDLRQQGWRASDENVQFANTFLLDLTDDEDTLLAAMKQKTRYNIRLADRRGVRVRPGGIEDLDLLYRMYAKTSLRDGFVIRTPEYYRDVWGSFIQADLAQPLIAEVEDEPLAALIVYRFGPTAYYLYGMSTAHHRELMPNHLLQWEAIRWAKASGCQIYDFWGAPDEIDPDDPLYGVYRFKQGFGACLVRSPGTWDLPIRHTRYRAYATLIPILLSLMRRRGMSQTRAQLE